MFNTHIKDIVRQKNTYDYKKLRCSAGVRNRSKNKHMIFDFCFDLGFFTVKKQLHFCTCTVRSQETVLLETIIIATRDCLQSHKHEAGKYFLFCDSLLQLIKQKFANKRLMREYEKYCITRQTYAVSQSMQYLS